MSPTWALKLSEVLTLISLHYSTLWYLPPQLAPPPSQYLTLYQKQCIAPLSKFVSVYKTYSVITTDSNLLQELYGYRVWVGDCPLWNLSTCSTQAHRNCFVSDFLCFFGAFTLFLSVWKIQWEKKIFMWESVQQCFGFEFQNFIYTTC